MEIYTIHDRYICVLIRLETKGERVLRRNRDRHLNFSQRTEKLFHARTGVGRVTLFLLLQVS